VGPSLIAILVSELPLIQPHLYDAQTPPVVYLSGVLLFIAGLAIVRVHNAWARNWTALVTLCGWFSLLFGLVRMFAASSYLQATQSSNSTMFVLLEGFFLAIALAITYKSYSDSSS
jgi:multisubunit Na+/H+ antiporter MnhG subunit